ncbi:hypothetical protein [Haloferula sp.]|uniref:hypothetical protein n=1 Tax=Haloferula sp. TaxID=2497595 RepID=UPI003C7383AD
MKLFPALSIALGLFVGSVQATPVSYRSMAFPRPTGLEAWMIDEGAALGFNDVCLHTEYSNQERQILAARDHLVETGALEKIEQQGMTISLWTREWVDVDESWGDLSTDNPLVWEKVSDRYDRILDVLFPEVDYLVFITAETKIDLEGEAYFRMVNLVHEKCVSRGKKLILRNFSHSPNELNQWPERAKRLPDDIIIQTKCVPIDWSLRAKAHPLIGKSPGHIEFVEFDAGGEYFRRDHMAVCATEYFEPLYNDAEQHGMKGISIRVERYDHHVFAHPNFINTYYLLGRATGAFKNADEAWKAFTESYYGKEIAAEMEAILRPTGEVFAESIHILDDIFGNSARDYLGAWKGDPIISEPYGWSYSPRNWAKPLFPDYDNSHFEAIDTGAPRIVDLETAAYKTQLESINQSIRRLEALKPKLDENTYLLHQWLLEETRFHLILMEEATLAWLYIKRIESGNAGDIDSTNQLIDQHLEKIKALIEQTSEAIDIQWRGRHHKATRGDYYDLPRLLRDFTDWRVKLENQEN